MINIDGSQSFQSFVIVIHINEAFMGRLDWAIEPSYLASAFSKFDKRAE